MRAGGVAVVGRAGGGLSVGQNEAATAGVAAPRSGERGGAATPSRKAEGASPARSASLTRSVLAGRGL